MFRGQGLRLRIKKFSSFFNVFKIFVKIFVSNEIYRLRCYLFYLNFSLQHVILIHVYVCIVHAVYKNALLFSLEY